MRPSRTVTSASQRTPTRITKSSASESSSIRSGIILLILSALALAAYWPAVASPFDFDDELAIVQNRSIRAAWPPSDALETPPLGTAVSGRPLANYSFALDYALNRKLGVAQVPESDGARQTIVYHITAIAIHVACAFLIYLLALRLLGQTSDGAKERGNFQTAAALVATIWLVHPIQTEAVNYLSQRSEILAALCGLVTLYASIRAWEVRTRTPDGATSPSVLSWSALAVIACIVGMGTKETMLVTPFLVVLYDLSFHGRWLEIRQRRWRLWLYGILMLTAIWPLALVISGGRGGTLGTGGSFGWFAYPLTQGWAIWRYLRLLIVPVGQAFDYGNRPVETWSAWLGLVLLIVLLAASVAAWCRPAQRRIGFVGLAFFLLLAPSSSVVPIRTEIAAERRAYLASALVIGLIVGTASAVRAALVQRDTASPRQDALFRGALLVVGIVFLIAGAAGSGYVTTSPMLRVAFTIGLAAVATLTCAQLLMPRQPWLSRSIPALVILVLISLTRTRSELYARLDAKWENAIRVTPNNGRAYDNLASAFLRTDPPQVAAADSVLRVGMRVDTTFVPLWVRSASIAQSQGRLADAESLLTVALRRHPLDAAATGRLGATLLAAGQPQRAVPYLLQYATFARSAEAYTLLGVAYLRLRQLDSAVSTLEIASRMDPSRLDSRRYLVATLVELNRGSEALPFATELVSLQPTDGVVLGLFALASAQAGDTASALAASARAVTHADDNANVFLFAGQAAQIAGKYDVAEQRFDSSLKLIPGNPQVIARLGLLKQAEGNIDEARTLLKAALRAQPDLVMARAALEKLDGVSPRSR